MKAFLSFLALILLTACGSESSGQSEKAQAPSAPVITSLKNEADMDLRKDQIDTLINREGVMVSTLSYSKPELGESYQAVGFTDKEGNLLKVMEYFNDGNGKNNGTRSFYLNKGKPFYTREQVNSLNGSDFNYYDRVSYYSENGDVTKTKERDGTIEDEVEQLPYKPVGLSKAPIDRAMRALNQDGEFATTFQGFVFQDAITYLVVGENKPDGFTSALKCDFQDQLITTLSSNQKKYMGTPLKVNFQEYTDPDGLTQQIYTGGSFAE